MARRYILDRAQMVPLRGRGALSSSPINGDPHGVFIVDGLGNSIELLGVGQQHFSESDFVF